jgi:hypothetical protein
MTSTATQEGRAAPQAGHPTGAQSKGVNNGPLRGKAEARHGRKSRQNCATRKHTVNPIASGISVATAVHFTLPVSL